MGGICQTPHRPRRPCTKRQRRAASPRARSSPAPGAWPPWRSSAARCGAAPSRASKSATGFSASPPATYPLSLCLPASALCSPALSPSAAASIAERRLPRVSRAGWPLVVKLALAQTIVQYAFFYVGVSHASGVRGSIVNATSTFLCVLVAALVFRQERPHRAQGPRLRHRLCRRHHRQPHRGRHGRGRHAYRRGLYPHRRLLLRRLVRTHPQLRPARESRRAQRLSVCARRARAQRCGASPRRQPPPHHPPPGSP